MDYQEAIENHINECRHRIDVIRNHMNTNGDADKDVRNKNIDVLKIAISAMQELMEYKELGTLEEVQDAVERQRAKKAILDKPIMILCCPSCGSYLQKVVDDEGSTEGFIPMYCKDCGQKIDADWSEEE